MPSYNMPISSYRRTVSNLYRCCVRVIIIEYSSTIMVHTVVQLFYVVHRSLLGRHCLCREDADVGVTVCITYSSQTSGRRPRGILLRSLLPNNLKSSHYRR